MLRKCKTVEDKTRQDKTQDKTRHKTRHKTRQDTRQDKTRQDGQNPAHHISRNRQNKTDRTRQYIQDNDPRLGRIECFGRARLWKTRQDKTRRTKHDTRHLSNRRDPRLGCSKGFGRVIYGRQDKIAQPQIPASDAANASEEPDNGRQDKTAGARL